MNIRIGLCGKMTSGKSLVAQYLVDNYDFKELAFASRLKVLCSEMFQLDMEKKDSKGRLILQQFAQRMREIDPMVWLRYVLAAIPTGGDIVVSDVRYPNEYWTLKDLGFVMVRMYVSRYGQEAMVRRVYPGVPLALLDDYSERALDKHNFDCIIDNDTYTPLEKVYEQVDRLVASIQEGKIVGSR